MDHRKFIETSGAAAGVAMLGGVASSVNPEVQELTAQKPVKNAKMYL